MLAFILKLVASYHKMAAAPPDLIPTFLAEIQKKKEKERGHIQAGKANLFRNP